MEQTDIETISSFSKRSDRTVMWITLSFALGGAMMEIASSTLSAFMKSGSGFPMLWGMWIPLCFMTIPPIHFLCRQIKAMQKRIDDLERLSTVTTASLRD